MRFTRQVLPITLICALFGCAASGSRGQDTATPQDTKVGAAPIKLTFAEVKLYSNDKLGFVLHANGAIEKADGAKLGKITEDGKIVSVGGETLVTLGADGVVVDKQGKKTNAQVLPDGTLAIDGKTHRFNDDGTLSGGKPGAPTIKVEGLTSAARRATMFFLTAILMPGENPPPPDTP